MSGTSDRERPSATPLFAGNGSSLVSSIKNSERHSTAKDTVQRKTQNSERHRTAKKTGQRKTQYSERHSTAKDSEQRKAQCPELGTGTFPPPPLFAGWLVPSTAHSR